MARTVSLIALAASLLVAGSASAQEEAKDNWVPLFNGTDLTGFTDALDNVSEWQVVNSVIEGRGGGRGQPGVLATDRQDFGDFKLRITYGYQKPGGGGIELRRTDESSHINCYFVSCCVNGFWEMAERPPGNVTKIKSYTYGQPLSPARTSARIPAATTRWHLLEITVKGDTITTTVNGQPADQFTDRKKAYSRGAIALFVRGDCVVQFKDISILELPK